MRHLQQGLLEFDLGVPNKLVVNVKGGPNIFSHFFFYLKVRFQSNFYGKNPGSKRPKIRIRSDLISGPQHWSWCSITEAGLCLCWMEINSVMLGCFLSPSLSIYLSLSFSLAVSFCISLSLSPPLSVSLYLFLSLSLSLSLPQSH